MDLPLHEMPDMNSGSNCHNWPESYVHQENIKLEEIEMTTENEFTKPFIPQEILSKFTKAINFITFVLLLKSKL